MAIYDMHGSEIGTAYGLDGSPLTDVYDVEGNKIKSSNVIKLMTYNVGQWWAGIGQPAPSESGDSVFNYTTSGKTIQFEKPSGLKNKLRELHRGIFERVKPDVFGIVEYWPYYTADGGSSSANSILSGQSKSEYLYNGGGYYQRMIGAKLPLDLSTVERNVYIPGTANYYDKVYTTIGGKQVALVVTHAPGGDEAPYENLAEYLLAEEYFICFGDFNRRPFRIEGGRAGMAEIFTEEEGFQLVNGWNGQVLNTCKNYLNHQGEPDFQGTPLDNIIVSSNIDILEVGMDETKLSYPELFRMYDTSTGNYYQQYDHFPLWATLRIN